MSYMVRDAGGPSLRGFPWPKTGKD